MKSLRSALRTFAIVLAMLAATRIAHAQQTPPAAAPSASATARPSVLDSAYDGRTHVEVAPYIWGPTVKGSFQFTIPRLLRRSGTGAAHILNANVQVGPSEYLPKLDSAAMFAFDARKGRADLFGDVIYLNAATTATIFSTVGGPLQRLQIPVRVDASARLAVAIWEAAAGYTIARSHNADLEFFAGARDFPLSFTFGYNATIGKRGLFTPSGSVTSYDRADDLIVGLRGRVFFGDGHLFVPYYGDMGWGYGNQTWEAYGGAGYAFNHGQSIVALWRALDYNALPPRTHVQKLSMGGPLLGYTLPL